MRACIVWTLFRCMHAARWRGGARTPSFPDPYCNSSIVGQINNGQLAGEDGEASIDVLVLLYSSTICA